MNGQPRASTLEELSLQVMPLKICSHTLGPLVANMLKECNQCSLVRGALLHQDHPHHSTAMQLLLRGHLHHSTAMQLLLRGHQDLPDLHMAPRLPQHDLNGQDPLVAR